MHYLAFILSMVVCSLTAQNNTNETKSLEGSSITVTIEKTRNNKGEMIFALHDEKTFMKGPGIQNTSSKIVDGKVTVTFKNVPNGNYAIMVLHDENENHRMDFDPNGMPKEDYGLSNNHMSFGPPQFYDAQFTIDGEDKNLSIRL